MKPSRIASVLPWVAAAALFIGCGGGGGPTSGLLDIHPAGDVANPDQGAADSGQSPDQWPDVARDTAPEDVPDAADPGLQDVGGDEAGPVDAWDDGDLGPEADATADTPPEADAVTCSTDADCAIARGLPPPCHAWVCDPTDGVCKDMAASDGVPCSSGGKCDPPGICQSGACQVDPSVNPCEDHNPCTDDLCDPVTGCSHVTNTAPCTDPDPCNGTGTCADGACVATTPPTCDDSNECTDDSCTAGVGCVHAPRDGTCDDGNACTVGDHCSAGQCVPLTMQSCDDHDPCTDDSCDPVAGCVHASNTAPCDDDNPCTAGDVCGGGLCQAGPALDCDDGNPCTAESCDPVAGCVFTPAVAACDDHDACTTGDTCQGIVCYPGTRLDCDDHDPCTDDSCDPVAGCVHVANTAPCDDGNPCTVGDTCGGGKCIPGAAATCDDGNPCTVDTCDKATGCAHAQAADGITCDDGNGCTTGDSCQAGKCHGTGLQCDDGNPCTDDLCDAAGCHHVFNTRACDDGDPCTTGDTCSAGKCTGVAMDCDDHNPCTTDTCSPTGGCAHTPNTGACDGGNKCTTGDTCKDGKCVPGQLVDCDDHNPCTNDWCSAAGGCKHDANTAPCEDGDKCTIGDRCQAGECASGTARSCDDGNACTNDSCDPVKGCVHVNNTSACEDGLFCTVDDHCKAGACVGGAARDCDDGVDCTVDVCTETSGCQHLTSAEVCDGKDNDCNGLTDDGLGTTTCGLGACQVTVPNCADGKPVACVPAKPGTEVCNGIDDDCDGVTDQGLGSTTCGVGACQVTVQNCVNGKPQSCVPGNPGVEVCNGLDDDCDGVTDPEGTTGCTTFWRDHDKDGFGAANDSKCLCAATGEYTADNAWDCDDNDATIPGDWTERCNGKDDDCNGKIDDGPIATLCPVAAGVDPHGTLTCATGKCAIACKGPTATGDGTYVPGWYDVNGDTTDGCECQADAGEGKGGASCGAAIALGSLDDTGGQIVVTGNLVPAGDEDWYTLKAVDASGGAEPDGCDRFNLQVHFTDNPGNAFMLDVYRGSCDSVSQTCKGGTLSEWATDFYTADKGECHCTTATQPSCVAPADYNACIKVTGDPFKCGSCPATGSAGTHMCADNTATFFIRVYAAPGAKPACASYSIEVSNGLYEWTGQQDSGTVTGP